MKPVVNAKIWHLQSTTLTKEPKLTPEGAGIDGSALARIIISTAVVSTSFKTIQLI